MMENDEAKYAVTEIETDTFRYTADREYGLVHVHIQSEDDYEDGIWFTPEELYTLAVEVPVILQRFGMPDGTISEQKKEEER